MKFGKFLAVENVFRLSIEDNMILVTRRPPTPSGDCYGVSKKEGKMNRLKSFMGLIVLLAALLLAVAPVMAAFVDTDMDGIPDSQDRLPKDPKNRWAATANGFNEVECYVMGLNHDELPTKVIKVGQAGNPAADTTDLAAALREAWLKPKTMVMIQEGTYDLDLFLKGRGIPWQVMVVGSWDKNFQKSNLRKTPTLIKGGGEVFVWSSEHDAEDRMVVKSIHFQSGSESAQTFSFGTMGSVAGLVLLENCEFESVNGYVVEQLPTVVITEVKWFLMSGCYVHGNKLDRGLSVMVGDGFHQVVNSTITENRKGVVAGSAQKNTLQVINSVLWSINGDVTTSSTTRLMTWNTNYKGLGGGFFSSSSKETMDDDHIFHGMIREDPKLNGSAAPLVGSPLVGIAISDYAPPTDAAGKNRNPADVGWLQHEFKNDRQPVMGQMVAGDLKVTKSSVPETVKLTVKRVGSIFDGNVAGLKFIFTNERTGDKYYGDLATKTVLKKSKINAVNDFKPGTIYLTTMANKLPAGTWNVTLDTFVKKPGEGWKSANFKTSTQFTKK